MQPEPSAEAAEVQAGGGGGGSGPLERGREGRERAREAALLLPRRHKRARRVRARRGP